MALRANKENKLNHEKYSIQLEEGRKKKKGTKNR